MAVDMFLLKLLSLGLHLGVLILIVRQGWYSLYRFREWHLAWGAFLVASGGIVASRLHDLWGPVNVTRFLLAVGVSLSMLVGLWVLGRIFGRQVTIAEPTDAAWIEIDSFSTIVTWDMQAVRLFGWTPEEALHLTLMATIIPPRDWEAHRDGMAHLLATGAEGRVIARTFAVNARRKVGDEIPVTIRITAVPQDDQTLHFRGEVRQLGIL